MRGLYLLLFLLGSCDVKTEVRREAPTAPTAPKSAEAPPVSTPARAESLPTSTASSAPIRVSLERSVITVVHDAKSTTLGALGGSYDFTTLAVLLAELKKVHPAERSVELAAKPDVEHSVVVAVMELAKGAGFTKIALVSE